MSFVKLRDLDVFTVNKYNGSKWKKWDAVNNKMLTADQWQDGFKKAHSLSIIWGNAEDPTVEVSNSQLGQMLLGVMNNGMSNILGRQFTVKTVGTGLETKYYINAYIDRGVQTPVNPPKTNPPKTEEPMTEEEVAKYL